MPPRPRRQKGKGKRRAAAASSAAEEEAKAQQRAMSGPGLRSNVAPPQGPLLSSSLASAAPLAVASSSSQPAAPYTVAANSAATAALIPRTGINRLADVELQLVMQMLDRRSLLNLARCSRRALHCARQPFAWKDAFAHICLRILAACVLPSPSVLCSSLLRFVPVRLMLDTGTDLTVVRYSSALRGLNLESIHVPDMLAADAAPAVLSFLASPLAAYLREVKLNLLTRPSRRFMRKLSGLPQLHMLSVDCSDGVSATYLAPLAKAPALTDLRLGFSRGDESCLPLLQPVLQCARLQAIGIAGARFDAGKTRTFLTRLGNSCPGLHELQLLPIRLGIGDPRLPARELRGAFDSLTRLQELQLTADHVTQETVDTISQLKQLRELQISVFGIEAADSWAALQELLRRLPTLSVSVEYRPKQEEEPSLAQFLALCRSQLRITVTKYFAQ